MSRPSSISQPDSLEIYLRAYIRRAEAKEKNTVPRAAGPRKWPTASEWVLVFDTETTTSASQSLRFGTYQVRKRGDLVEKGVFYDPEGMGVGELATLRSFAAREKLKVRTRDEFVDKVFYPIGFGFRGMIVGFNLPFDISRIAIHHASARGDMKGGFTFQLSQDGRNPNIQVKHLSSRAALIRFAIGRQQMRAKSARKRGDRAPARRGHFVDVRTLAGALFSGGFSLDGLCKHLNIENKKLAGAVHGVELTEEYLRYACQDTQATWECYAELSKKYHKLGLDCTLVNKILSEASLGKAYLAQMGVQPFMQVCPNFPSSVLAKIMSAYFGGRSEAHIRKDVQRVILCDFLSMYPTVCTLMGLWKFIIAENLTTVDCTAEIQRFLDLIDIAGLQNPDIWKQLTVLVQVEADGDVFPVRAKYSADQQATIGLNILPDGVFWFTLADCIASRLLTGKSPRVRQAIKFVPGEIQSALRTININGDPSCAVNPEKDDLFKLIIEMRAEIKSALDRASEEEKQVLNTTQQALKILANSTSYGIYAEINIKELSEKSTLGIFHPDGDFEIEAEKSEDVGKYFHPLVATLITGAARLMLAMAERLVLDEGLNWAFCDTDSIAIAKPAEMADREFESRVKRIVSYFEALNPYNFSGSILKIEEYNFKMGSKTVHEPLYAVVISSKRYALFNLDEQRRPVIRKASAHGLGHLVEPYTEANPSERFPPPKVSLSELSVGLWQHDLWQSIIEAALAGHPDQVSKDFHPMMMQPALSRYSATTPELLLWFNAYNEGRPYRDQIRPFGFMLSLFGLSSIEAPPPEQIVGDQPCRSLGWERPRPVAPYESSPELAIRAAFDRETKKPVASERLKTYQQAIRDYHLKPEAKFLNGEAFDRGITTRRTVVPSSVRFIGKEGHRIEERSFLSLEESVVADYGCAPGSDNPWMDELRTYIQQFGQRGMAKAAGVSRPNLAAILAGRTEPRPVTIFRLVEAGRALARSAGPGAPRKLKSDS